MKKILVTGANGQVGVEITSALRARYGRDNVIAADVSHAPHGELTATGQYIRMDVCDSVMVKSIVEEHRFDTIFHLAALLSAVAEMKPLAAWHINMDGLFNVLEVARKNRCAVFYPSSIAAFGPETPSENTPQVTVQRPKSIYGITKLSGELLCDYYFKRYGVDTRGLRFPGLVSNKAYPGGGTTDYAVEIFYAAIRFKNYACFLRPDTRLDMMYMPDAVRAAVSLMEAGTAGLVHRNAYNVTAMSFTPEEVAAEICKHIPDFTIEYRIDPVRQAIADTWPRQMDDSMARAEWNWYSEFDLSGMVEDMLVQIEKKLTGKKTEE